MERPNNPAVKNDWLQALGKQQLTINNLYHI